jgi:hypothetical protein
LNVQIFLIHSRKFDNGDLACLSQRPLQQNAVVGCAKDYSGCDV